MYNRKDLEAQGFELFEDSVPNDLPQVQDVKWEISEAEGPSGVVDGVSILGRAVGPFFVIDGKSQNNRFYEGKLWRRVLGEAQQTIQKGQMLGTMGHGQPLDDAALLEGKVSHRVSKLWIDENRKIGMGEVLILNTPAGRTLNAYLRGGVEFPVSSRGYGKYSGQMEDGTRIVDSETYKLECFDFVRVPGIPTAIPKLVEAKGKDFDKEDEDSEEKDTKKKTSNNDEKSTPPFMKKDTDDKSKEKDDDEGEEKDETRVVVSQHKPLEEVNAKRSPQVEHRKVLKMEDTAVFTKITEEKIRLEENLNQALTNNARLNDTIKALQGQIEEQAVALEGYRKLGTTEDITKVMDVTETMLHNRPVEESDFVALREQLEVYEELGTPEELEALFDKFETFMNQYEDLGTPEDLNKALDTSAELLEGYSELGSPVDINEAFDSVETFMGEMSELGTVAELHAICDLLEAYQEFGTPSELKRAFEMMNAVIENTTRTHMKNEGKILATEFGVEQTIAESLITSMGAVKARETLGAINESRGVSARYVAPAKNEKTPVREDALNEDAPVRTSMSTTLFNATASSRASRLFTKLS